MKLTIRPVKTRQDLRRFVRFPWTIYKNDPHWVPPIISDQTKFLVKGPFLEVGERELFLAVKDGKPAGRLSAHLNHQYEEHWDRETGFFGFFECVNDPDVAKALFNAAEAWLKARGKTKILGPESFSIYDECALLVEGFDDDPTLLLAYNPDYYESLLLECGFKKAVDWYAYMGDEAVKVTETMQKIRERVLKRERVVIKTLKKDEFRKRAEEVKDIFNEAWRENWGHLPFTETQFKYLFAEMKRVAVPELTYFAEAGGRTIGFSLTIKDANQALKRARGRLFPFGLLKILWGLKKVSRLRTIVMGVLKEYRNRGIDTVFYLNTIENGRKMGYTESECSMVVETNTKMLKALEAIGARRYKTYRLYEKPIG